MHHDHESHSDTCEVCVVVKNFNSSDIPKFGIELSTFTNLYEINYLLYHYIDTTVLKGYHSTAPPLFL